MASIAKRSGGYRVKYRDPLGRQKSKSFVTKDDARRFSREIEVDKTRGAWLDPSDADIPHPPKVRKTEMKFLTWEQSITLAEAHAERFQAMIYRAVDSGMRWGGLIGLQRKNLDPANRRVRVVDQLLRTADGKFHRTAPHRAEDVGVGSLDHDFEDDGRDSRRAPGARCRCRSRRTGVPELRRQSAGRIELLRAPLQEGTGGDRAETAISRPLPHQRGLGDRRGSAPRGEVELDFEVE